MASADLIAYIKNSVNQGYSVASVRANLLSAGYSGQEIDAAMQEAFHAEAGGRGISIPWKMILLVTVALILVVMLVYGVVVLLSPSDEILRINLEAVPKSLGAGEDLSFSRSAILGGVGEEQSVSIEYEVVNERTRERIASDTESLTFKDTSRKEFEIDLPTDLKTGRYILQATFTYKDNKVTDSARFSIIGLDAAEEGVELPRFDETPPPVGPSGGLECIPSCNDYDTCTRDRCVSGKCVFDTIAPCCGNFECEPGENEATCSQDCKVRPLTQGEAIIEIRERAEDLAKKKTEDAVTLCKSIAVSAQADSCLKSVAGITDKSDVCSNINGVKLKDSCYLDFALKKKQGNVCQHIADRWMAQSCTIYTTSRPTE